MDIATGVSVAAVSLTAGALIIAAMQKRELKTKWFTLGGVAKGKPEEKKCKDSPLGHPEGSANYHNELMSYAILLYKDLKDDVKEDVLRTASVLFSLYRSSFICALKESGVPSSGIEHHASVIAYELMLKASMSDIVKPNLKRSIYKNNFPVKLAGETDEQFTQRFFRDQTEPLFETLTGISMTMFSSNWGAVPELDRGEYTKTYLAAISQPAMKEVNSLLRTAQRRRQHYVTIIKSRFPKESYETIDILWKLIYE